MSVLQYDTASSKPGSVLPLSGADAGYISGLYNNYRLIRQARPNAIVLPILTRMPLPGELFAYRQIAFDCESGDLTPGQIPAANMAAHAAGIPCPIDYGSRDTWIQLDSILAGSARGIDYQAWLANPDADPTVPAGYAAKQYLFGPDYDTSIVADPQVFYNLPPSPPHPPGDTAMVAPYTTADGRTGFVVESPTGVIRHIEQTAPGADWWRKPDGSPNWLSLGTPGP